LVGFSNFVIQRRSTATAEEEEEEEGEEEEEADLASYPRALRANFHFWVHCFVAMGATAKTPLLQAQDHSAHNGNTTAGEDVHAVSDLEAGDAVKAKNVGFGRILELAKPETAVLIFATIALLISSLSNVLLVCAHFTLSSLMSGVNIFLLEL
jgi:hypothetical protein